MKATLCQPRNRSAAIGFVFVIACLICMLLALPLLAQKGNSRGNTRNKKIAQVSANESPQEVPQQTQQSAIAAAQNVSISIGVPTPATSPSPSEETSSQSIKVSSSGIELSGFPFWLNAIVLLIAAAAVAFLIWRRLTKKSEGKGWIVVPVLIGLMAAFWVGRIWDRRDATAELNGKLQLAAEQSRNETKPEIPSTPIGATSVAISDSQINLSWGDVSSTEEGFIVERKLGDSGSFSPLATLGPNATSFADTGLAPETAAHYRVKAFNHAGVSDVSNEAVAISLSKPTTEMNLWSSPRAVSVYIIAPVLLLAITMFLFYAVVLQVRYRQLMRLEDRLERRRYDG